MNIKTQGSPPPPFLENSEVWVSLCLETGYPLTLAKVLSFSGIPFVQKSQIDPQFCWQRNLRKAV
jgi:hypothetical protein